MEDLKQIVSRVFDIGINEINDELAYNNTEAWDSFRHLLLISEIEKEMGIKFTILEVQNIKTFKELRETIRNKR